jgi:hypothetical protein
LALARISFTSIVHSGDLATQSAADETYKASKAAAVKKVLTD